MRRGGRTWPTPRALNASTMLCRFSTVVPPSMRTVRSLRRREQARAGARAEQLRHSARVLLFYPPCPTPRTRAKSAQGTHILLLLLLLLLLLAGPCFPAGLPSCACRRGAHKHPHTHAPHGVGHQALHHVERRRGRGHHHEALLGGHHRLGQRAQHGQLACA